MSPAFPVTEARRRLTVWYRRNRRALPWRRTRDPYRIWVSEVMLQQTRVDTAEPYWLRFLERFPSVEDLARADQQAVLKSWEGLGYYARARNLHRAAQIVCREHGGRVPDREEDFRRLPGVGDYIAAAVLSIAFDRPLAVVDGNVRRVLARLRQIDAPVNRSSSARIFARLAAELLDTDRPGEFNQALMELGALVCTPRNPSCPACPLRAFCRSRAAGDTAEYPRRVATAALPERRRVMGVVRRPDGRLLIVRRPADGLLGGMWEFPGGEPLPDENAERACRRVMGERVGLSVLPERHLARVRHAYTHFRLVAEAWLCRSPGGRVSLCGPQAFRWVFPGDLGRFALHKANHKVMPHLLRALDLT